MPAAPFLHRSFAALRSTALICSLLLATSGMTGCLLDQAKVRVLNASLDYQAIDLQVDDDVEQSGIAYATVSDYLGMDAGTYTMAFKSTGLSSTLASVSETLDDNSHKTLVAYGRTGNFDVLEIDEDEDDADSGETSLQIINAAADAGAVDVYLTDATTALDAATPVSTDVAVGANDAGYITVSSGTYRLRITAAGSTSDVRLDVPSFSLSSKQVATLVVADTAGGVLVNAMLLTQQGVLALKNNTQARVRSAVAIENGTAVTATIGETGLVTGAVVTTIGGYKLADAGAAAVTLSVDGSAVAAAAQSLTAGHDYTLLVWDNASGTQTTLIDDDNRLPRGDDAAKIRLVHAMSGLTDPTSLAVDFSPVAESLAQGQASAFTELSSTVDSRLDVTNASTTATLFTQTDTSLLAEGVYTMFVFGEPTETTAKLRKDR